MDSVNLLFVWIFFDVWVARDSLGSGIAKLKSLFDSDKFRIFNADETGVSCVYKNDRFLSQKGKKQVGKMISAERLQNVTVMVCMNVIGTYNPPLLRFKGQWIYYS